MKCQLQVLAALLVLAPAADAHDAGDTVRYLANAGVMAQLGDTRILFDPLFDESFGRYSLVPAGMRRALLRGDPPWDGVDAVFISHYHDDHFAPGALLDYLRAQPGIEVYAPQQAIAALRATAGGHDPALLTRLHAVSLRYGDPPETVLTDDLRIDAVRIPHSGWPSRRTDVENIAWRVTLHGSITVLHLGDADARTAHFAQHEAFWAERQANMAFPPYWIFLSDEGRRVLDDFLRPMYAVGLHVPVAVPADDRQRRPALQGVDLFTRPGETRPVPHEH